VPNLQHYIKVNEMPILLNKYYVIIDLRLHRNLVELAWLSWLRAEGWSLQTPWRRKVFFIMKNRLTTENFKNLTVSCDTILCDICFV
jgi:hypothetical protein